MRCDEFCEVVTMKNVKKLIVMVIIIGCMLFTGCVQEGVIVTSRSAKVCNNKDDVKVQGIKKLVIIDDRDYYVVYAQLRNNTDSVLKNVKFYVEVRNKKGEIIDENVCFEVDEIPAGKSEMGDYFGYITDENNVKELGTITFIEYEYDNSKGVKKSTNPVEFDMANERVERME